jgi:hypothetical protein
MLNLCWLAEATAQQSASKVNHDNKVQQQLHDTSVYLLRCAVERKALAPAPKV